MGWKTKAKVHLENIKASLRDLEEELVSSKETTQSLEDYGSDSLKEQVEEFYDYLENDAFNETEDPEEEEERDDEDDTEDSDNEDEDDDSEDLDEENSNL